MTKINPMTGEIIDELDPIRRRVEAIEGETWFTKAQYGAVEVADIHVTLDGEDYVVAEHVSDPVAAELIAHAPEDIRTLLGRVDAFQSFINAKRAELSQARRDQKWEYGKGRVMDGMAYERHGDRLQSLVEQLEGVWN